MREIKFRAWDKPINRWYSPVYESYKGQLEELNISMNGRLSLRTMSGTVDESTFKDRFAVMQYTGLKDKNNKEIYEGDIVNCHIFVQELGENYGVVEGEREFVGKVSFDVTGFNVESNGFRDNPVMYDEFHEESLEVVGNIYENPELLEATL
jgi:uncharacterized phage protein (TIGR01671 family)